MSTSQTWSPSEVYLDLYPDVARHYYYGSRPYEHYLRCGKKEGKVWPSPQQYQRIIFDQESKFTIKSTSINNSTSPDDSTSTNDSKSTDKSIPTNQSTFTNEGQTCEDDKSLATENTSSLVSTPVLRPHRVYLEQNPDIDTTASDFQGPLHHYLTVGKSEGRSWPRGKVLLIFFGSFTSPVYTKMLLWRRLIMEKYDIPHINILQGRIPPNYRLTENDYHYPQVGLKPHITVQFLKTIRKVNVEDYTRIVRVNCTTYVNIPKLIREIEHHPTVNYVGGSLRRMGSGKVQPGEKIGIHPHYFWGLFTIFSSDVLVYLRQDKFLSHPRLRTTPDDLLLSGIFLQGIPVEKYYVGDIIYFEGQDRLPAPAALQQAREKMFVRCKNLTNRMAIDIGIWKYLLEHVDAITVQ
jgi:hypothetical protein